MSPITIAIYPASIVQWTDRVDELNTVFAEDPNAIAAEVGAIESYLGVNPQIEKLPIIGTTTTYNTVDARLSDMLNGNQIPVLALSSPSQMIDNWQSAGSNYGEWNTYNVNFDPFNMYNGADITIPVAGWWHLTAAQTWDWWSTGFHAMSLWISGVQFRQDIWQWDFPGNQVTSIPNYWYKPGDQRPAPTSIDWQGVLQAGQRIRILSENGCPHTPHQTSSMSLALSFVRSVASSIPSSVS